MAKRRKRGARGRFAKAGGATTRRRRRRRSTAVVRRNPPMALATNPRRGRRRRRRSIGSVSLTRRSRRRLRRNPPSIRGILGNAIDGAKNGTAVFAGQVLARKIRGAVQGMLPSSMNVSTGFGQVGVTFGAAIAASVAVGFLPGSLRRFGPFIVAGAFSEAISSAAAQTPVAPYLSAFPNRRVIRVGNGRNGNRVGAWPAARGGAALGAWPMPVSMGLPMNVGT